MTRERQWIRARGRRLWCRLRDASGKWINQKTPYFVGDEKRAEDYARTGQRELDRQRAAAAELGTVGLPTLAEYTKRWIASREGRVDSSRDDRSRLDHALKHLGAMRIDTIRLRHVRDMVRSVRAESGLAPRTVLHVYRTLHTLFQTAIQDELLVANPCQLGRDDLPKKVDKNPAWRATAVYTHEEVEALISDERLPADRRIMYSILGLTGARFSEAAALRWTAYDRSLWPLRRLSIHESIDKSGNLKPTKTEATRLVPVHPVLDAILAWWHATGWAELMGRPPLEGDLIIPSRRGRYRSVRLTHRRLQEDLDRLGARPRRTHDLRRTFISLARADGASKDVLRWITHGPTGDIVDLYTTLPWVTLCDAVAVLDIAGPQLPGAPAGEPETIDSVSGEGGTVLPFPTRTVAGELVTPRYSPRKGQQSQLKRSGADGTRNRSDGQQRQANGLDSDGAGTPAGQSQTATVTALVTALDDAIKAGESELALALTRRLGALSAPSATDEAVSPARPPRRRR